MCSPDKGCEVVDGELIHKLRDKNDSKNFSDSDDAHILVKCLGHNKVP